VEPVCYDDPLLVLLHLGHHRRSKAAVLTHGQMAFVVTNHLADLMPGTDRADASLVVAPLSHGAGVHALLNVARGAVTVLLPGERSSIPRRLAADRASTASPTCSPCRPS
jgi:fatty-acyl-CoA synthase